MQWAYFTFYGSRSRPILSFMACVVGLLYCLLAHEMGQFCHLYIVSGLILLFMGSYWVYFVVYGPPMGLFGRHLCPYRHILSFMACVVGLLYCLLVCEVSLFCRLYIVSGLILSFMGLYWVYFVLRASIGPFWWASLSL